MQQLARTAACNACRDRSLCLRHHLCPTAVSLSPVSCRYSMYFPSSDQLYCLHRRRSYVTAKQAQVYHHKHGHFMQKPCAPLQTPAGLSKPTADRWPGCHIVRHFIKYRLNCSQPRQATCLMPRRASLVTILASSLGPSAGCTQTFSTSLSLDGAR